MVAALILIAVICILLLFSIRGRVGHKGLQVLRGWSYAHRGLHGENCPENSMAAFRKALDNGYGIEFDVHLLADGNLAVMHDSSLKRTCGCDGIMEELTTEELDKYFLEGTQETIPQFRQVLELFDGKAPLIIELKAHDGNAAQLTETACKMLEHYHGDYCIESFDPRCLLWLKEHRPELVRGLLSENYMKGTLKLPFLLRLMLTYQFGNFLFQPDFIAYRYPDRQTLTNDLCRKFWKMQGVSWTLKTPEEYDTAVSEGWIPIFEGFLP
jgi:glycerophosphoryl diester phosphodiesterase